MIEKKTIVDQIEVTRNGTVQIRFGLLLLEDGKEIDCKWHRTSIEPGGDVDAQIAAVNGHLGQLGRMQVDQGGLERVYAVVSIAHSAQVVATFEADRAASLEKNVPVRE